jgi:single-strand DNA-binding protein
MASYNRVVLLGNMTRDPQLKYLPSQTPVCEFGLATNRKFKAANGEDREEVCFVDCAAFGKQAEVINQYCQKGKALLIEGRLKYDSWEDKQGGGKRSKLSVVIENFQFIGGRDGGGGGGGAPSAGPDQPEASAEPPPPRPPVNRPPVARAPRPASAGAAPAAAVEPPFGESQEIKEDDIPF